MMVKNGLKTCRWGFQTRSRAGFSLLVALIFTTFFGAVLATFVYGRTGESLENEARVTGIQAAKIARAARVFVRDALAADRNLAQTLDILGAGPQIITINNLINAGLLPQNFTRQNGVGQSFTPLDQEITIYMANYPIDGDPLDPLTIPTAYVYLRDSQRSNPKLVQDIVAAIRREDVAISAPLYDNAVNLSGACNGMGDSVMIWDTGCMGLIEFTALTGEAAFVPGSLMIPAWRAIQIDPLILTRFPQPQSPNASAMLTEIEMGDPLADCETNPASQIIIPSDSGGQTELCDTFDDDVAQADLENADRRRDILNTNNLEGNALIIHRQAGNDVTYDTVTALRSDAASDEGTAWNVTGNLTATGDMKVFDGDMTITGTTSVDRNVIVPSNAATDVTARIGGVLSGATLSTGELIVSDMVVTPSPISATETIATPTANFTTSLVTQQMQMDTAGARITTNNADLLGVTEADTLNISGSSVVSGFSFIAAEFDTQNLTVGGNIEATERISVIGHTDTGRIDTFECRGDCPRRTEAELRDGVLDTPIGPGS